MASEAPLFDTILVVDDEAFIRNIVKDFLSDMAEQILVATNGKEGLDMARDQIPELIISDLMMPEMNGFELLEGLRSHRDTEDIPVILMTVKEDDQDLVDGYSLGADYYLPKPFEPEALLHAIEKAVYVRRKKTRPDAQPVDDDFIDE